MFTLTFHDLNNPDFVGGLRRLGQVRGLRHDVAYNLAKILKDVGAEMEVIDGLKEKMIEPYLLKDEAGKRVPGDQPNSFKIDPEMTEAVNAALAEFHKGEVTIDRKKVNLELVATHLSPNEIMLLEPLWQPLSDESVPEKERRTPAAGLAPVPN